MTVDSVADVGTSSVTRRLWAGSTDIFAGLATSVMSVAYGLSFAALIFAPPLTPWLAYGIAATFITSAISAAIGMPGPNPSCAWPGLPLRACHAGTRQFLEQR